MAGPTKEQVEQLWALHDSPERKRELLLRSYGFDDTRQWVDPNGYQLSDRIWVARQASRQQIDALIRHSLATGEDALDLAKKLEQYLNPSLIPVRNQFGQLIRNQKPSVVTRWPGRGGMGSFSARRLARTEIARAHGQATIETAKRTPFATGVKWNLSGRHPKADECNENADRNSRGLPKGVYTTGDVPRYPAHPMCLCFLTTETESDIDKVVASLRDQYGLGGEGETPPIDVVTGLPTSAVPTFKNKDAVRAFIGSLGTTVEGTGGNIDLWRMVAETFAREQAAGSTFPPKVIFGGGGKNAVAQFSQAFSQQGELLREQIEFRTGGTFWRDPAKVTQQQFDAGFWSSNDPSHAITHELAHFRHRQLAPQGDIYGYTLEIDGVKVSRNWSGLSTNPSADIDIARRVSRYAATDPSEFVAETYAGIRAGNTYDEEVMALYRKWKGPTP